ncbi:ATP-dependent rRNA helicase SPB4 [Intoshia linei]|uniref:ATP-dependent RNA helicase n=1 Tax=Intoshia linei TaxID=1819745 RepID=A0A177B8R8_9BILA|nr:ATP-dependent rRNA helicase SPB4 [Intoshia linei]
MEVQWSQLNPHIHPKLIKALIKCNFKRPTNVQISTIQKLNKNFDVVVEAITGSGKTLAFVVPILQKLLNSTINKYHVNSIIISPTRELAQQTFNLFSMLINALELKNSLFLLVGGKNIKDSVRSMDKIGCNILVVTPGRLLQLLKLDDYSLLGKKAKLVVSLPPLCCLVKNLKFLVLDEADRLIDLGFIKSISSILNYLPKQRRTALLSATLRDGTIQELVRTGLRNPVEIFVKQSVYSDVCSSKEMNNSLKRTSDSVDEVDTGEFRTPTSLINYYTVIEANDKLPFLLNFFNENNNIKVILFMPTCSCVDYFGYILKKLLPNRKIFLLHRKIVNRQKEMDSFYSSKSSILICTDILSRGIDVPGIDWVIHYEAPSNASAFVHRCGRTARMGNKGYSLLFLSKSELLYLDFIKRNQKVEMKNYDVPKISCTSTEEMFENLRKDLSNDRDLYIKSIKAFVSFIQFYKKHECYMILNYRDLNIDSLAIGYGLLHLPKMTEMSRMNRSNKFKELKIDFTKIPFKDSVKEENRLKSLSKEKTNKKIVVKKKKFKVKKKSNSKKMNELLEIEEINADFRILQRYKKKKISKQEFESLLITMKKILKNKISLNSANMDSLQMRNNIQTGVLSSIKTLNKHDSNISNQYTKMEYLKVDNKPEYLNKIAIVVQSGVTRVEKYVSEEYIMWQLSYILKKKLTSCAMIEDIINELMSHTDLSERDSFAVKGLNAKTEKILVPSDISYPKNNFHFSQEEELKMSNLKEFVKKFKAKRISLNMTQHDVGNVLEFPDLNIGYSQSSVCRFENLDLSISAALKMRPIIEKWMINVDRNQNCQGRIESVYHNVTKRCTKRKSRTCFTKSDIDILSTFFENNTHPNDLELKEISQYMKYQESVIRVWFSNKRQQIKLKSQKFVMS